MLTTRATETTVIIEGMAEDRTVRRRQKAIKSPDLPFLLQTVEVAKAKQLLSILRSLKLLLTVLLY